MTSHPQFKTFVLVVVILLPIAINQFYPGEVFHHCKYLFILTSFLAFLLALLHSYQQGVNGLICRSLTISLLTLLCLLPSWFGSINKSRSQEVFWLFLAYLLLLLSVAWLDFDFKQIEGAAAAVCVVAAIVCLVALYQYFFGLDELRKRFQETSFLEPGFKSRVLDRIQSRRVLANFPLPNTLSGFLAMILPLQTYFAISRFRLRGGIAGSAHGVARKSRLMTALTMAGILLSIIVLGLTQSFGGWAAVLASVSLAGVLLLIPRNLRLRQVAAGLVVILILLGVWMAWVTHERGFSLSNLKARTNPMVLRWNNYKTAWHIFADFPWTGVGLGNYGSINPHYQSSPLTVTQYAHNTPLQLLSEVGVMAFILVAGLMVLSYTSLRRLVDNVKRVSQGLNHLNPSTENSHPLRDRISSTLHSERSAERSVQIATSTVACWEGVEARDRITLSIVLASSLAAWGVHNLIDIDLYFPSVGGLGIFILGVWLTLVRANRVERERSVSSGWFARSLWTMGLVVLSVLSILVGRQYLAQTSLARGMGSVATNDLSTAQDEFRDSLNFDPNNPTAIALEARVRLQLAIQRQQVDRRLLESVFLSFEKATALDPYNAETVYELGRLLMALGREDDAVKAGLKAHNLFPSEPRYQEPFKAVKVKLK